MERRGAVGTGQAINSQSRPSIIEDQNSKSENKVQTLRDKKREEIKLSQNMVEEKKKTKSNDLYEKLKFRLKLEKNGSTLLDNQEREDSQEQKQSQNHHNIHDNEEKKNDLFQNEEGQGQNKLCEQDMNQKRSSTDSLELNIRKEEEKDVEKLELDLIKEFIEEEERPLLH